MNRILCRLFALVFSAFSLFAQSLDEPELVIRMLPENQLQISWPNIFPGFLLESSDSLAGDALWSTASTAPTQTATEFVVTISPSRQQQFLRLHQQSGPSVTYLTSTSPLNGETGVAVTRETIITFSAPLAPNTVLSTNAFYATFGERRILSRIELSSDRTKASLFYLEPLPGSSRIAVTFDGNAVFDRGGLSVDADGDGVAGGKALILFDTLSLSPLAGTAVIGTVFASDLLPGPDTGTNAVNKPLAGVTITVDGMEQELRTVTDANGIFKLSPVPPGRFFVHIDGRTVTNTGAGIHYPDRSYYPFVGKAWEAVAGKTNNLAGGTGTIYLPLITQGTLQPVSMVQDTTIVFPPNVVSSNPALAGVSVTVPANSLFNDNGTRGGKVGIAPVPPDRLPGPLPPGAGMPIVITVQTDGALNFDRPAPVCFPNLPNPITGKPWPAGTKGSLISFNHKKGLWEDVGDMTVSVDGKFFCTDPGVGITQPGWHGVQSPKPAGPPPPPPFRCKHSNDAFDGCSENCRDEQEQCLDAVDKAMAASREICNSFKDVLPDNQVNGCLEQTFLPLLHRRNQCNLDFEKCLAHCINCYGSGAPPSVGGLRGFSAARSIQAVTTPAPDSIRNKINSLFDQAFTLVQPFILNHQTVPVGTQQQVDSLIAQADAEAGGSASNYLQTLIAQREGQMLAGALAAGIDPLDLNVGNAPAWPVRYAAVIARPAGLLTLRGETGPYGQYSLLLPPDGTLLYASFYDAKSNSFGLITPNLSPTAKYRLPRFSLFPVPLGTSDFDKDGLPDIIENVLGTDSSNSDSDGDGIPDGAEMEQGTNPLDGFAVQTGVIATTKTLGAAIDVWTGADLVATAEGSAGVSLFNTYNGSTLTILAHIATPAPAQRVFGTESFITVAAGTAGLLVIDARDPAAARIVQQLRFGSAQSIVAGGGVAYAGLSSGQVISVELGSGLVLGTMQLGADAIQDLALEGDYLYALTRDRLYVVSLLDFVATGSAASPFPATQNTRLFVGGGIAYTVHGKGYNTLDLSDPTRPVLLATGNTTQVGWRHLAANGSGLGVAVVGPNSPDSSDRNVSLYDLSNPRTNNIFLTSFPTPGNARAVSIYKALAFVADDSAGLQVVNYLPYDNKHVPPAITLTSSAGAAGLQEGNSARLSARVSDDVQVRNVEFYIDSVKVFTDGSFPFEYRFIAPLRTATKSSVTLRARAFDTGGNSTWSDELTLSLTPDATPPRVTQVSPIAGDKAVTTLLAHFNEPINPATLSPASFRVFSVGRDGQPETSDDVLMNGGVVTYTADSRLASLTFANPLPDGAYRAVIASSVTDLAHNPLPADYTWQFQVADAVFWTSALDGVWNNPLNWSTRSVPGPNDNVIIDIGSTEITVTISGGTNQFQNLTANERLLASNAIIQPAGEIRLHKNMTIDRSTIRGGTITTSDGAKLVCINNIPSTLDAVTLSGDLDVTSQLARVFIRNGLKLNGTISVDRAGNLTFPGTQTFQTGAIVFGGQSAVGFINSLTAPDANTTLTLGLNVVLRGNVVSIAGNGTLVNQGLISADVPAGPITIGTKGYTNSGTNECRNGGSLTINSAAWNNTGLIRSTGSGSITFGNLWTNTGVIEMTDSTLNLGGTFALTQLGPIHRTGGTLKLTGNLNLTGSTLALNASTGSLVMDRGTITGGTVTLSDGAKLICINNIPSTLDGVSIQGDLDVTTQLARVFIRHGLNITGNVLVDRGGNVTFVGNQAFGGNIVFGGLVGGGSFPNTVTIDNNTTLTLGSSAVLHGKTMALNGAATGILINQGLISADVAGGAFSIACPRFTNAGTSECRNGASLALTSANWDNSGTLNALGGGTLSFMDSWTNTGTIIVDAATLDLGGTFTLDQLGILKRTNGTIKVSGVLNLSGHTLALNANTGSWQLERGTINGGTVTLADNARFLIVGNIPATLDGVSIQGDLDVISQLARVFIRHGLNITGSVLVDRGGNVTFTGNQTFGGNIAFGGLVGGGSFPNTVTIDNNTTLTLGSSAVLHGKTMALNGAATGILINQGLISADVAGGAFSIASPRFTNAGTSECRNGASLALSSANWDNSGTLNALGGGTLSFMDSWTNTGTINVDAATLDLGGTFTLDQLGILKRTNGTIKVSGVLNLTGNTLALNANTGSWVLDRGTIIGGTVTLGGGARLICINNIPSTLDGVSIQGDLDVTSQLARVFIRNGLNITGTVLVDRGGNLTFEGTQSFPTGAIAFGSLTGGSFPNTMTINKGTILTLGPATVLRGHTAVISGPGSIINQGRISADVNGGTIRIDVDQFTNTGIVEEKNGGKVVVVP